MLNTSGSVSPVKLSKPASMAKATVSSGPYGAAMNQRTQKYDCASFSNYYEANDSFHKNLVGRLSQELRTATTTADIRELHQEVQSGSYTPDPMAIAGRMLFFTEG